MPTRGILYVATQKEHYVQEAFLSAVSVKDRFPQLPITLFTDRPASPLCATGVFNNIEPLEPTSDLTSSWSEGQLARLKCLSRTPYDHTLNLDTDTRLLTDRLLDLFEITADVAMVEDPVAHSYARKFSRRAMFNAGLILYRRTPKVWSWLEEWLRSTARNFLLAEQDPLPLVPELAHVEDIAIRRALLRIDQIALTEMLSPDRNLFDLAFQHLDYGWNFRGPTAESAGITVHISHNEMYRITAVPDLLALADSLVKTRAHATGRLLYDYVAGLQSHPSLGKKWYQRKPSPPPLPDEWADAELRRADLHLRYGQTERAFKTFHGIAQARPDDPLCATGLARVALSAGHLEDALNMSEAAFHASPSSSYIRATYGEALISAGRPKDAIAAMRKPAAGTTAAECFQLGQACMKVADYARAEKSYRETLARSPDHSGAKNNLLPALLGLRRYEDVLVHADGILDAQPWHVPALAFKCVALTETGCRAEERALTNRDEFLNTARVEAPTGFASVAAFNRALADAFMADAALVYEPKGNTARGGYQGNLSHSNNPVIQALNQIILDATDKLRDRLRQRRDHVFTRWVPRAYRMNSWVAVLEDGGYQSAHIHPAGWLSGVYYVDLPEEIAPADPAHNGWIRFGRSEERWYRDGTVTDDLEICPEPGVLLTFPSYYWHATNPLKASRRRISYAFDIMPA